MYPNWKFERAGQREHKLEVTNGWFYIVSHALYELYDNLTMLIYRRSKLPSTKLNVVAQS